MLAGSHRNAWPDETGTGGRTNRNTHGQNNNESILLNPNELMSWYGFNGPYHIAKTCIPVEPSEEWSIVLDDGQHRVCLLCSSDVDFAKMPVVDLVAALGHGVTLCSWQKLYFCTNRYSSTYVTYLLDCTSVPLKD